VLDGYETLNDAYGVAKNHLYLGDDFRAEIEAKLKEDDIVQTNPLIPYQERRNELAKRLQSLISILNSAEQCYREAVNRLEALGENNLLSRAYRSLGDVLRFRALVDDSPDLQQESLHALTHALDIESYGDLGRRLPTTYESLARLAWDMGSLAAASSHYSSALEVLSRPELSPTDASSEHLRTRCQRARNALLSQLASSPTEQPRADRSSSWLGDDEGTAGSWRQLSQQLLDTVRRAIQKKDVIPVAFSVVHPKWANLLAEIEREDGPRYLAQNLLSTSLSTAVPGGYEADAGEAHSLRYDRFTAGVGASQKHKGSSSYRDICWGNAVRRAIKNPVSEELCTKQVEGAQRLLKEKPEGYHLFVSAYELPLGFLIKDSHVLFEIPAKLAPFFDPRYIEDLSTSSMLCFYIKDNHELAAELKVLFDKFAEHCEANVEQISHWLETLIDQREPMLSATSAL
jgi:hypothetical protein